VSEQSPPRRAAKILCHAHSAAGRIRLAERSSGTEHSFVPTPSVSSVRIDSLISAEGHPEAAHNPEGGTFLSFLHTVLFFSHFLSWLALWLRSRYKVHTAVQGWC
jgi:hypothetical protein